MRNLILLGLVCSGLAALSAAPAAYAGIGDMDPSYGEGGRFEVRKHGSYFVYALSADGHALFPVEGGYRRADRDGHPEDGFGIGGVQSFACNGLALSWLRLRDGNLLAVGSALGAVTDEYHLCRFDLDGAPDLTFGLAGAASFQGPDSGPDTGRWTSLAMLEQPDGRILVKFGHQNWDAYLYDDSYDRYAVLRLLDDGSRDPTFGDLGIVEFGVAAEGGFAVLADGRIRVGSIFLNEDGQRADSAPVAGVLPDSATRNWWIETLLPEGGAIVLQQGSGPEPYRIARLRADGTVDPGFGDNGVVTFPSSSWNQSVLADVEVSGDGRYLYLTWYGRFAGTTTVARIHATGAAQGRLDAEFGRDGFVEIDASGYYFQELRGLADGSVIVRGVDYTFRLLGNSTPSPGFVLLDQGFSSFRESSGTISLRVARAAGKDGLLRVQYATRFPFAPDPDVSYATPGKDFEAAAGELVWEDGDDSDKYIQIRVHADSTSEGTEQIPLELSAPTEGSWILNSYAYVALTDGGRSVAQPIDTQAGRGGGGAVELGFLLLGLLRAARGLRLPSRTGA